MAKLSPEAVQAYMEAHCKDTGEQLSYAEAATRANELVELMIVLAQPIPELDSLLPSQGTLPPPVVKEQQA